LGAGLITVAWAKSASTRRAASGLLAAGLVGAVLVGAFARAALLQRFHESIVTSLRAQTAPTVRHAADLYFPFGSGLGSFDPVYRALEPIGAVTSSYFNHAHDDALELLVETGVFGMSVLGAFLVWWLWIAARLLTRGRDAASQVAAFASLAVLALLAHSLVDYPLRTTAMASLFALACGLMALRPRRTSPSGNPARDGPGPSRRGRDSPSNRPLCKLRHAWSGLETGYDRSSLPHPARDRRRRTRSRDGP